MIEFCSLDCCGSYDSAHMTGKDGVEIGVRRTGNLYSVTVFKDGGASERHAFVDSKGLSTILGDLGIIHPKA